MQAWRASLPMYNFPEMRAENAAFWDALRAEWEGPAELPEALCCEVPNRCFFVDIIEDGT